MNILIYFGNQLNPHNGGTERVACLISDYLKRRGHNIFHLSCHPAAGEGSIDSSFLPDEVESPTEANREFILQLINRKRIDLIINEGAFSDSVYLFSHEYIPKSVQIISHIHFNPLSDDRHFYKSLNLPIRGVGLKEACISALKWLKAPYNKLMSLSNKKARFRYMLEYSDKVILLTANYVRDFKRIVKSGDFGKLLFMRNPITFEDSNCTEGQKLNDIIFVGRLDYASKRVDRILQVWALLHAKYHDWTLTIVGDGNDRERLERIAAKLKLERVKFVGHADSRPYYEKAKLLLMTSNYEGCPMVIYEAMTYGVVPVVMGTFSGAYDMITENVNGLITKPFDIKDMANAINMLIQSPNRLNKLSINAKETIALIDNDAILSTWDNLIS